MFKFLKSLHFHRWLPIRRYYIQGDSTDRILWKCQICNKTKSRYIGPGRP